MKFIATCTVILALTGSMPSAAAFELRTSSNACDLAKEKLQNLSKDCDKMTGVSSTDACKKIAEECSDAVTGGDFSKALENPNAVKKCPPLAKLKLSSLEKQREELKEKTEKLDKRKKEITDQIEKLATEKRQARKDERETKRDQRKDVREQQRDYNEKIRTAREDMQKAISESQEKIAELTTTSNTQLGEIQGQMNEVQTTSAAKDIEIETQKMGYIDSCDTEATKFLQAVMEKRRQREEQGLLRSNNLNAVLGRGRSLQSVKDSFFSDCINSASFSRKMQALHRSKMDTISSSKTALQSLQERMQQVQQDQRSSANAIQTSAMQQMQAKQNEIAQLNKDLTGISQDLDDDEDEEEEAETIEKRIEAKGREHDAIVKQQNEAELKLQATEIELNETRKAAGAASGGDSTNLAAIRWLNKAIDDINTEVGVKCSQTGRTASREEAETSSTLTADAKAKAEKEKKEKAARERTPAEVIPSPTTPAATARSTTAR